MDNKQKIKLLEKIVNNLWKNFNYCNEYSNYCSGAYNEEDFMKIAEKHAEEPASLADCSDSDITEIVDYISSIVDVDSTNIGILLNLNITDMLRIDKVLGTITYSNKTDSNVNNNNNSFEFTTEYMQKPETKVITEEYFKFFTFLITKMFNLITTMVQDDKGIVDNLYNKIIKAKKICDKIAMQDSIIDWDQYDDDISLCETVLDDCLGLLTKHKEMLTDSQLQEYQEIFQLNEGAAVDLSSKKILNDNFEDLI